MYRAIRIVGKRLLTCMGSEPTRHHCESYKAQCVFAVFLFIFLLHSV